MGYWNDKVVLVTGAASGIGRATAIRFAREGAAVALLDRNKSGLEETVQKSSEPKACRPITVDLRDEKATLAAVEQVAQWKGRLDAVANVAGVCPPEEFLESTREYWDTLMDTNLRACFLIAREAARRMIRNGGGAVVNVSSVLALVGDPATATYCATKGGVSALTRAMALKLAPFRIRVNAVCPGAVGTPMTEDWIQQTKDPPAARAKLASAYPLGYIAQAEDIAAVIFFLSGPEARCITGANIVVDCGMSVSFAESAIWSELF